MTKKATKVPLTHDELVILLEALKLWRQALVAQASVEFHSKEQKNLLADVRVDVETMIEKIDLLWRGK